MFALKRDHRGTPAVVEAVRQSCSHFAATKADQDFDGDLCCSAGKTHATAVLAGDVSVCGTISVSIVRGASCKVCYPGCSLERLQNGVHAIWGNMHVGTHGQSKCHACELETTCLRQAATYIHTYIYIYIYVYICLTGN